MRVRQSARLRITSDTLDPETIAGRLGLPPTRAARRGSKLAGPPPVPRFHWVDYETGVPDTRRLDEHLEAIERLLESRRRPIKDLVRGGDVGAGVRVVRYFDPGSEDIAVLEGYGFDADGTRDGFVKLGGQHVLLGFAIGDSLMATLADLGLWLDFDEYGDESD